MNISPLINEIINSFNESFKGVFCFYQIVFSLK